jgi:hypothetical protein
VKISETLCLDHFYIRVSPEQFKELINLKDYISGFIHKVVKVKGDSWEGAYLRTNSGEYIEFMQLKKDQHEGLGLAFSSKSPIYTDIRDLKKEFKKLKWEKGTRTWKDGSKWFTWLSIKSKKEDKALAAHLVTWAMFYHPRYHQSKSVPAKLNKPNSMARIIRLDLLMNSKLEKFVQHHLQWSSAVITQAKKGMKIEIPNREFETFTINIIFDDTCENFIFQKIILETHRMKNVKLPKLKTIKLKQKNGVVILENALMKSSFEI